MLMLSDVLANCPGFNLPPPPHPINSRANKERRSWYIVSHARSPSLPRKHTQTNHKGIFWPPPPLPSKPTQITFASSPPHCDLPLHRCWGACVLSFPLPPPWLARLLYTLVISQPPAGSISFQQLPPP